MKNIEKKFGVEYVYIAIEINTIFKYFFLVKKKNSDFHKTLQVEGV